MSDWEEAWKKKQAGAQEALSHVRNGDTIYIGSGPGEPALLTRTLAGMADRFSDIRIIHLIAHGDQPLAKPELRHSFQYNTFFIGRSIAEAIAERTAEYTPMNLSELPSNITKGIIPVDVALIQVTPPNEDGKVSLGVSVGAAKAAVEKAKLVIAQVNRNMPRTSGGSLIPVEEIDYMVEGDQPLIEVPSPELDPVSLSIGRRIANFIGDGRTLHFDSGKICSAVMRHLVSKKELGIHTDILNDDILRLIRSGAVTNDFKIIDNGKTVATMVHGSQELYDAIHDNQDIELYPIDYVNDPYVISKIANMVTILQIQEIELSGLARVDTKSSADYQHLPSSTDFINGTRAAPNGIVIMALPSTSMDGKKSNIVVESSGRGVYFNRAKVDVVVTEYGSVYINGKSLRERTIGLISIAHPRFRQSLLEEAKQRKYIDRDHVIYSEIGSEYPDQYEFRHTFKDGLSVLFRPIKPMDARRLQKFFYSLSEDTIQMRYHGSIKTLTIENAQRLTNIDYSKDMAIVGLVGPRISPTIIAEGRITYNPNNNLGEFDIVVSEDFRGRGIGHFLANYLNKIAYSKGMSGVFAEVGRHNSATMGLLTKAWPAATKQFESGTVILTTKFPTAAVNRPKDSIIIYSGRFNDYAYGEHHPFKPMRARTTLNTIKDGGFLDEPWMRIQEPNIVAKEKLYESHDPGYIDALEHANDGNWTMDYLQYHLGGDDCPVFKGMFDYIMLYTSATLTAVDLIMNENANVVFNLLGGFHHSSRGMAEGFCYVNDALAAIDTLLANSYRVAYIDIDAHHGNGVQDAYYKDDRVLTISVHETGKNIYPWTGFETEIGDEQGEGFNINFPLPEGTDDEAYEIIFDRLITRAVKLFNPNVVVCVCGADTHKNDPLTNLNLTNNGMVEAIKRIRTYSNHLLMLSGGGYDVKSTSRAWARMWGAANRIDALPDYLLSMGGTFLGEEDLRGAEVIDRAYVVSGEEKSLILDEIDRIIDFHNETTMVILEKNLLDRSDADHGRDHPGPGDAGLQEDKVLDPAEIDSDE